jgi:hypothetical protein
MIDLRLIIEITIYALIFIISSVVPIYLYIRSKVTIPIGCSLLSLGITLLLVLIYASSPLPKGKTGELYEIFWLIPPIFVGITTYLLSKTKKKTRG